MTGGAICICARVVRPPLLEVGTTQERSRASQPGCALVFCALVAAEVQPLIADLATILPERQDRYGQSPGRFLGDGANERDRARGINSLAVFIVVGITYPRPILAGSKCGRTSAPRSRSWPLNSRNRLATCRRQRRIKRQTCNQKRRSPRLKGRSIAGRFRVFTLIACFEGPAQAQELPGSGPFELQAVRLWRTDPASARR